MRDIVGTLGVTAIALTGLRKRFAAGGTVALDDVSLEVQAGEIFGIVGRSGAGKSTLIRTVNLLERPDAGRIEVLGQDMLALDDAGLRAARRGIGMVFQHFNLHTRRTVAENVAFPLEIAGLSRAERRARVDEILPLVGLEGKRDSYPAQLSGGQKQRVGIARALASRPGLLLCDEATSALDPETTRNILALIADLNRELGLTIVLITHEMEVVRQVCDRVAVLHAGRVAETGSVANVFLRPQAAETRALIDEDDQGAQPIAFDGPVVRLTLQGEAVLQPVLTRIARETGTDFAILDGRIGRLKDAGFGQLTLGLTGGDTEAALAALRRHGEVAA